MAFQWNERDWRDKYSGETGQSRFSNSMKYWDMGGDYFQSGHLHDGPTWREQRLAAEEQRAMRQRMMNPLSNHAGLKAARKFSPAAFGLSAGIDTYMNMKAGDSFGTAAVKGVASGMLWHAMPGIMTAHLLATTVPGVVSAVQDWTRNKEVWYYKQHLPNFGGNYVDTQRALTMRQAAVQAIQGSKLNARSALGGEARIFAQHTYRT